MATDVKVPGTYEIFNIYIRAEKRTKESFVTIKCGVKGIVLSALRSNKPTVYPLYILVFR